MTRALPTMKPHKVTRDFQPFLRRSRYIDKLTRRLQEAQAERLEAALDLLARLDLKTAHPLQHGFEVLDLLSHITVDPDGHWIWTGHINNKGTPVIYPHIGKNRSYFGVAGLVHHAVTGVDHQKAYHPRCGHQSCVRPSHRCAKCE